MGESMRGRSGDLELGKDFVGRSVRKIRVMTRRTPTDSVPGLVRMFCLSWNWKISFLWVKLNPKLGGIHEQAA
jgi:hypothetical protein